MNIFGAGSGLHRAELHLPRYPGSCTRATARQARGQQMPAGGNRFARACVRPDLEFSHGTFPPLKYGGRIAEWLDKLIKLDASRATVRSSIGSATKPAGEATADGGLRSPSNRPVNYSPVEEGGRGRVGAAVAVSAGRLALVTSSG